VLAAPARLPKKVVLFERDRRLAGIVAGLEASGVVASAHAAAHLVAAAGKAVASGARLTGARFSRLSDTERRDLDYALGEIVAWGVRVPQWRRILDIVADCSVSPVESANRAAVTSPHESSEKRPDTV
jgi:hypothetical protein